MATLNFKQAHTFSITGGIYSSARHVTMISGIVDPQIIARDYFQHGRSPRSSRRRSRTPSPSSSDSSFISSADSSSNRHSSPPTSVDEHESLSSQTVPPSFHERPDVLSPLSSRLGAMAGLTTPVRRPTPVASEQANIPQASHSSDTIRPVIPRPDESSASVRTPGSPYFYHHPGVELIGDIGTRIRPQGPRRRRPLPPTPTSQVVHPGTPAGSFSTTGGPSRVSGSSSSQSSWDSFIQEPPHSVARSSTAPPRPNQPMRPSRHTVRADVLTPSPSYAVHNSHSSLSSSSQARSSSSHMFLPSPIRQSFVESVTSPSRRSVQSPPPNRPFHVLPLPSPSAQSRAAPSTSSPLSPPRNLPFQSIPLPPRSTPPRISTASGSYAPSRASHQTFRPPPAVQTYQSSAWSMGYPETNMPPPVSYHYHSQTQNLPNQDFIYSSSPPGAPQQYLSRSPRLAPEFAYLPQPPYLLCPQSQQSVYEHPYQYYDGPSMSPPH